MDTQGAPAVAERLGISLPTLHRALPEISGNRKARGRNVRLAEKTVQELLRRFGSVPKLEGFTRLEVQVLIALSRHPRGMISARQVAKSARVSPTSASRAIRSLTKKGLVRSRIARVFEGKVEDRPVIEVDWATPKWRSIAPKLSAAVLPSPEVQGAAPSRLPPRLASTFWSGNWRQVDVTAHPDQVAYRILNEGRFDPEAVAYLGFLPEQAVRKAANQGL